MLLAGFGFFLQNFQLRIGTYLYVHKMVHYELMLQAPNSTLHPEFYSYPIDPSFGKTPQDVSFGSLQDTGSSFLGYEYVKIGFLDKLAALFPFVFLVLVCGIDLPRTWTKIMLSFFFLAVGKGFFSWCTNIPDSGGWEICKERLGNSSYPVEWYLQERSVTEILFMDPRSRLCADMMWSGHTYFVAIFAFGLHECIRRGMSKWPWWQRWLCETIVAVVAIGQQFLEIYFVLRSRFHYTADVFMAVFVTYLLYTNATICVLAKIWTDTPYHVSVDMALMLALSEDPDESGISANLESVWLHKSLESSGDMSLGCCCCSWARMHIYSGGRVKNLMNDIGHLSKIAKPNFSSDTRHYKFNKATRDLVMDAMGLLTGEELEGRDEEWPYDPYDQVEDSSCC